MSRSIIQLASALVLIVLMISCCSAYIVNDIPKDGEVNDVMEVTEVKDKEETAVQDEGRRFGWAINWLNDRGMFGQIIANLVVALFVLPPLGPWVCTIFENCDSLKIRARSFLHTLSDSLPSADRRSRSLQDELDNVLSRLDAAYDKYD